MFAFRHVPLAFLLRSTRLVRHHDMRPLYAFHDARSNKRLPPNAFNCMRSTICDPRCAFHDMCSTICVPRNAFHNTRSTIYALHLICVPPNMRSTRYAFHQICVHHVCVPPYMRSTIYAFHHMRSTKCLLNSPVRVPLQCDTTTQAKPTLYTTQTPLAKLCERTHFENKRVPPSACRLFPKSCNVKSVFVMCL